MDVGWFFSTCLKCCGGEEHLMFTTPVAQENGPWVVGMSAWENCVYDCEGQYLSHLKNKCMCCCEICLAVRQSSLEWKNIYLKLDRLRWCEADHKRSLWDVKRLVSDLLLAMNHNCDFIMTLKRKMQYGSCLCYPEMCLKQWMENQDEH